MDGCGLSCYIVIDTYGLLRATHSRNPWHHYILYFWEVIYLMLTKDELPECPVATTVQLIGSKWKLLIMRNLLMRPWRFNELKKSLEGISQKVLTDSLRSMEEDGLITRTIYPEVPPRVEYALSDLGETMRPILDAMQEWGTNYKNGTI